MSDVRHKYISGDTKAPYYILYPGQECSNCHAIQPNIDLIDVSFHNIATYMYQRINIMSRIWRAGRVDDVTIERDLNNAKYEIERWLQRINKK